MRSAILFAFLIVGATAACNLALPKPAGPTPPGAAPAASPIAGSPITTTPIAAAALPPGAAVPTQTRSRPQIAPAPEPDADTGTEPPQPEAVAVAVEPEAPVLTVLPSPEEIACGKKKGIWGAAGSSGAKTCSKATRDSGKRCDRKSQCEGQCLARSGTCAPMVPLFGCNDIFQDDGRRVTLCID